MRGKARQGRQRGEVCGGYIDVSHFRAMTTFGDKISRRIELPGSPIARRNHEGCGGGGENQEVGERLFNVGS